MTFTFDFSTLWDHSLLTYAANKQTNKQTDSKIPPTSIDRVGIVGNNLSAERSISANINIIFGIIRMGRPVPNILFVCYSVRIVGRKSVFVLDRIVRRKVHRIRIVRKFRHTFLCTQQRLLTSRSGRWPSDGLCGAIFSWI